VFSPTRLSPKSGGGGALKTATERHTEDSSAAPKWRRA